MLRLPLAELHFWQQQIVFSQESLPPKLLASMWSTVIETPLPLVFPQYPHVWLSLLRIPVLDQYSGATWKGTLTNFNRRITLGRLKIVPLIDRISLVSSYSMISALPWMTRFRARSSFVDPRPS